MFTTRTAATIGRAHDKKIPVDAERNAAVSGKRASRDNATSTFSTGTSVNRANPINPPSCILKTLLIITHNANEIRPRAPPIISSFAKGVTRKMTAASRPARAAPP